MHVSVIALQRTRLVSHGGCRPSDRRDILRAVLLPDAPEWAPLVAEIDSALAPHDIAARGKDRIDRVLSSKVSL